MKWNFLYPNEYNAYKHAILVLVLGVIMMLLSLIIKSTGVELEETFIWMIVAACSLLFAGSCSIYAAFNKNFNQFLLHAVVSYLSLVVVMCFLAYFISKIPISKAGTYYKILMVVTFCFLVLLSLVNAVRAIIEYAQKEEWNHPKLRRRK